ncbi:hypothetical protein PEL8287_01860 [Roseovarius litorisediminis]|uniref:Uncharacterized protein n=1 Tax=Roseovarius litorisediminis TaxID=1312363 RepID=A0A1Y5SDH3_9RHOB|nr:hypothetical protein [Roseovarius litorisediminis]SLN38240.1 hypothetical protein PEL8287_01860 [Roseovarius litorisediminis]
MKHSDTLEFTSQFEPTFPFTNRSTTIREKIKARFSSLFAPRFDPTKMKKVEQREAGIMECEVDWYNALHGPLIK